MLFNSDSDYYVAMPWPVELAEVNTLPGAERKASIDDRDHDSEAHQGCLDVGIGIPLGMPVIKPATLTTL